MAYGYVASYCGDGVNRQYLKVHHLRSVAEMDGRVMWPRKRKVRIEMVEWDGVNQPRYIISRPMTAQNLEAHDPFVR